MSVGKQIRLPARINVVGNPADAVEGDFAVISAAINLYAHALVLPHTELVIRHYTSEPLAGGTLLSEASFRTGEFPLTMMEGLQLQMGALNRLAAHSPEFRANSARQGVEIRTWTDVPRSSGLGGSSLLVLLVLAGMRAYYQLNRQLHNDYFLAELAQRVESLELGITCGYADRYVPLFGGLLYIDYRGKLMQAPLGQEPLATVERLDDHVAALPLVLVSSGVEHDSGDVHTRMREKYLQEIKQRVAGGNANGPMETAMRWAYESAWRGKFDLLHGDLEAFGQRMKNNHQAVDAMMQYCGFRSGAGTANNLLIDSAYRLGAYGAKLSGAGAGGSVFAVVQPGAEQSFGERWLQTARQAGLQEARLFIPQISRSGLQVASVEEV